MEKNYHPLAKIKRDVDKTLLTLPLLIPREKNTSKQALCEWIEERLYSVEDSSVLVKLLCDHLQRSNIPNEIKRRAIIKVKKTACTISNSAVFPKDLSNILLSSFEKIRGAINRTSVDMFEEASDVVQDILSRTKETRNVEKKKRKFKYALPVLEKKIESTKRLLVLYDEYIAVLCELKAFEMVFKAGDYKKVLNFGWAYSCTPNCFSTETITDELLLCYYNLFVLRLELVLALIDQRKQANFDTVSIRDGFEDEAFPKLSDEIGVCSYILKKMTEIGSEYKPTRFEVLSGTGIIPNVKQVHVLSQWLFIIKREVTFITEHDKYLEPEHASKLAEFGKLMSVMSKTIVHQMITTDNKSMSPEYRGLSFILKWCWYADYFYNMVAELGMMIDYHAKNDMKRALLWRDRLLSNYNVAGKKLKSLQKAMKELYDIAGPNNNAFSSIFFFVDDKFFNAVAQQKNSTTRSSLFQLSEPASTLAEIISVKPHTRGFDVELYLKIAKICKEKIKLVKEDNKMWNEQPYTPINGESVTIKYDTKGPKYMEEKPYSIVVPVEIPTRKSKMIHGENFRNFTRVFESHVSNHFNIFVDKQTQTIDLEEEMHKIDQTDASALFDRCETVSKQLKTILHKFLNIKSEILESDQYQRIIHYLKSMEKMWLTMRDAFNQEFQKPQINSEGEENGDVESDVDVESVLNSSDEFEGSGEGDNTIEYMVKWLAIATKSMEHINALERALVSA